MSVEVLNYLKKSLGIIIKRLEETGVFTIPSAHDHTFIPEITVDDIGTKLDVNGFVYSIKAYDAPVKVNFDRPVSNEFTVVFPGTVKLIYRYANSVYLKAPMGQTSRVTLEVLRGAGIG